MRTQFEYSLYHCGGMWPRKAFLTSLFFVFSPLTCRVPGEGIIKQDSTWETCLEN